MDGRLLEIVVVGFVCIYVCRELCERGEVILFSLSNVTIHHKLELNNYRLG